MLNGHMLHADVVVAAAAAPLPGELLEVLDEKLKEQNLVEGSPKFSGKFISTLKDFILQQVGFHNVLPHLHGVSVQLYCACKEITSCA